MLGKPGFASNNAIYIAENNYVTIPRGLARDTKYVPHPNWLRTCRSCTSMLTRPCPMGRELWTNLGDSVAFNSPSPNQRHVVPGTWFPTDRRIGQKIKVSTLQSYNPTPYSINAYTFMANISFNRSFLTPMCNVIWVYYLYYSPWRVKMTALVPGGNGNVVIDAILSTWRCNLSEIEVVFSW